MPCRIVERDLAVIYMGFRLHNYKTNTQQLPSTTGSGWPWSTDIPVCECNVGYENMETNCSCKSINTL